jgi:biotin-(acetyl-CoA carboxylase) ligase
MPLLKLNVESICNSELIVSTNNPKKQSVNSRKIINVMSNIILGVGINLTYPQNSFAEQLPTKVKEDIIARDYTYSQECFYCFEEPTLTGSLENRIRQLETYIRNKEINFLSKYHQQPEVVKHDSEQAKFRARVESLKKQLRRSKR